MCMFLTVVSTILKQDYTHHLVPLCLCLFTDCSQLWTWRFRSDYALGLCFGYSRFSVWISCCSWTAEFKIVGNNFIIVKYCGHEMLVPVSRFGDAIVGCVAIMQSLQVSYNNYCFLTSQWFYCWWNNMTIYTAL